MKLRLTRHSHNVIRRIANYKHIPTGAALALLLTTKYAEADEPTKTPADILEMRYDHSVLLIDFVTNVEIDTIPLQLHIKLLPESGYSMPALLVEMITRNLVPIEEDNDGIATILIEENQS